MPSPRGRGGVASAIAIAAVALSVRVWWLVTLPLDVGRDGSTYARLGENLAHGAGYRDLSGALHAFYPPGYPLAIAPFVRLAGDGEHAGRFVSFVSGVAVVILASL